MNDVNSKLLNQMTLNKLTRTLARQMDAIAETKHHIELVKNAIEQAEKEEAAKSPPLFDTKNKK